MIVIFVFDTIDITLIVVCYVFDNDVGVYVVCVVWCGKFVCVGDVCVLVDVFVGVHVIVCGVGVLECDVGLCDHCHGGVGC